MPNTDGKTPHKRTRTGCLTCRKDGYKCDEEKPYCRRCVRLGKTCQGYGLQLRWRQVGATQPGGQSSTKRRTFVKPDPDAPGPGSGSPPDRRALITAAQCRFARQTSSPASGRLDYLPSDTTLTDRRLFHHWRTVVAAMVSMSDDTANNPFLTNLTPLMVESAALRSATLSMAALHLSLLQNGDSSSSLEIISRRHRLASVSSLRQTMQTSEAEMSLATILMLQLSDRMFTTADDSPADHLVGARAVIQAHQRKWDTSSVWSFLLGVYLYQDVLASVTKGASPLSEIEDGIMVEGLGSLSRLTAVVRVVGHISRMHGMDRAAMRDYGMGLEGVLNSLEDPDGPQDDIGSTVEAYRHAAIIYLYRVAYSIGAPHPISLHHTGACLRLLSRIPATSAIVSAHVWPLWTGGCESIDAAHRDFVRSRLAEMYRLRQLPSLKRVRCDMEEVWKIKDEQRASTGTDTVDCIKTILKNRRRTADLI